MFRPVLHGHPQMHVKVLFSALSVQNMTFVKYFKYFVFYIFSRIYKSVCFYAYLVPICIAIVFNYSLFALTLNLLAPTRVGARINS